MDHVFGQSSGPNERVLVNSTTGLAISGYDPLAYFINGKAKLGRPDMELSIGGTVWRFGNDGNRSAFADHPDVYSPRYRGYDPVAIARGVSVPGHPAIWTITGGKLYLFYDDAARAAFLADHDRILETADRKWPDVTRTLPQ